MTLGLSDGSQFPDQFSLFAAYAGDKIRDKADQNQTEPAPDDAGKLTPGKDSIPSNLGPDQPWDKYTSTMPLGATEKPVGASNLDPGSLVPHDEDTTSALHSLGFHDDEKLAANEHQPLNPDVLGQQLNDASGGIEKLVGGFKPNIALKEQVSDGYNSKFYSYQVHQNDEHVGNLDFRVNTAQPDKALLTWAGRAYNASTPLDRPNSLGASVVRESFRQFLTMHPEIKEVYADRVSGARGSAGTAGRIGFTIQDGKLSLMSKYKNPETKPTTYENYDMRGHLDDLLDNAGNKPPAPEDDPGAWQGMPLRSRQGQYLPQDSSLTALGQAMWRNVMQQNDLARNADQRPSTAPQTSISDMGQSMWRQRMREMPQELGILGSSIQGPLQMTGQMGQHANWDKFMQNQRPSTNIEDDRDRKKPISEQLEANSDRRINDITNLLFK